MTDIHPAQTTRHSTPPLIAASRGEIRQDPLDDRTLYVLGFSTAGVILAYAILLTYFASSLG